MNSRNAMQTQSPHSAKRELFREGETTERYKEKTQKHKYKLGDREKINDGLKFVH